MFGEWGSRVSTTFKVDAEAFRPRESAGVEAAVLDGVRPAQPT